MVILITQVAAGLVIYFQKETLKEELSHIVGSLIEKYDPLNEDERNLQDAWDYVQTQVSHGVQQDADDAIWQCSQWPLKLG